MRKLIVALVLLGAAGLAPAAAAEASGWTTSVPFTNAVASSPVVGGGYPDPGGTPDPGTCGPGTFTNRSESWIANDPGTENLVGASKFFFDRYSTFYNFYLGSYTILATRTGRTCTRTAPSTSPTATTTAAPG